MSREARVSLPEVLDAIGLKRGVLLGHSDGASISAIYAGELSDERIRGLVLMAPHVFTEPMGLASIAEARRAYETGDLRAKLAKYHAHVDCRLSRLERRLARSWLRGLEYRGCDQPLARPSARHPGRRRPIWNPEASPRHRGSLARPGQSLILERCRHAPQFDQPEATLEAIVQFCADLAPRSPRNKRQ